MFHQLSTFVMAQLHGNQFFSGAVMGGGLIGLFHYCRGIPEKIYDSILSRMSITLQFNSEDVMYQYIQIWMSTQAKFDKYKKKYNVHSKKKTRNKYAEDDSDEKEIPEFIFAPHNGSYTFRYKGKWMHLICNRTDPSKPTPGTSSFIYETMTLHYLGRNLKHAEVFLDDIKKLFSADNISAVHIYIPWYGGSDWSKHNRLFHRNLSGVICRDDIIENLRHDIEEFKKKETEKWYIDMGVPYHRGYLFVGPPGTGKTSTAYAIASHFNMNIYYLNINSTITDTNFMQLVSNCGDNSFLVLEDIDCVFDKDRNKKSDNKISFSTMLNALDGFCAKHGNMVIMTTNHPERIDPALMRPGRMDYKIHFDLCDRKQLRELFLKFFPDRDVQARAFAITLEEDKYSPAVIQEYLLTRKGQVDKALLEVYSIQDKQKENENEWKKSKVVKKIGGKKCRGGKEQKSVPKTVQYGPLPKDVSRTG